MLAFIAVLLAAGLIAIAQGRPLLDRNRRNELLVFAGLLLIGVWLYANLIFGLPFANPTKLIARLAEPLSKPVTDWIKQ